MPVSTTERVRAARERKKDGRSLVSVELDAELIAHLVAQRWIPDAQSLDRNALQAGIQGFLETAAAFSMRCPIVLEWAPPLGGADRMAPGWRPAISAKPPTIPLDRAA